MLTSRPYSDADRTACLAVFDSNLGISFFPFERPEFEAHLDSSSRNYLVIEDGTEIVACGGYAANVDNPSVADLCWGMVRRDRQGSGLGRNLVEVRLRAIRAAGVYAAVFLSTDATAAPFYEKLGFKTTRVIRDGIAEGVDRHEMTLRLG